MRHGGKAVLCVAGGVFLMIRQAHAQDVYSQWPSSALANPNFFPIAVWYQTNTYEVPLYKAIGVNTIVVPYGDSPVANTSMLNAIRTNGMHAITPYDSSALPYVTDSNQTIIAWFSSPDEPDNAQPNGSGGYGPPVAPWTQISEYNTIKGENSALPVEEGFGRGVAYANYVGRGVRDGHQEDYPAVTNGVWSDGTHFTQGYLASTDIASFDIYPANEYNGQTSLVAQGTANLVKWSKPGGQPVWTDIETTNISGGGAPTPQQTKAEVWLALVNGAHGINYFADSWVVNGSTFEEDALVIDPESASMRTELTAVDNQIESLAAVLNSPTVNHGITAKGTTLDVQFMTKVLNNKEYIFTATDEIGQNGTVTFDDPTLAGLTTTMYELLDTGTTQPISLIDGQFSAAFTTNDAHVYEIPLPVPEPAGLALLASGSVLLLRRRRSQHA